MRVKASAISAIFLILIEVCGGSRSGFGLNLHAKTCRCFEKSDSQDRGCVAENKIGLDDRKEPLKYNIFSFYGNGSGLL